MKISNRLCLLVSSGTKFSIYQHHIHGIPLFVDATRSSWEILMAPALSRFSEFFTFHVGGPLPIVVRCVIENSAG